jgi:SAM-dependent methyltransferase
MAGSPPPPDTPPGQTSGAEDGAATAGGAYAARLVRLSTARWKQRLDVQRPYRLMLQNLALGRVLDVGSGVGRNLANLRGNGVGVDHNATSVRIARERGWEAYTPEEFSASAHARPGAFDALLMAHVAEHVSAEVAAQLLARYLPYVRPGGRAVFICPQERGWATDDTHIRFVDFAGLTELAEGAGLTVERTRSFPFPRAAGRVFPYNEFVLVARLPG